MLHPQFERQAADQVKTASLGSRDDGPARRLDVQRAHLAAANRGAASGRTMSRSRVGCLGTIALWLTHLTLRLQVPSITHRRSATPWPARPHRNGINAPGSAD